MTFNNNLGSESEIRRLMKLHKIKREDAVILYLRLRIEHLN